MVKTIQDELREAHEQIRAIVNRATAEDRDLSDQEDHAVKVLQARLEDLSRKRARRDGHDNLLRTVESLVANGSAPSERRMFPPGSAGLTPGQAFTQSDEFRALLAQLPSRGPRNSVSVEVPLPRELAIQNAALVSPAGGWPAMTQLPQPPPLAPVLMPRVSSLFARGTAEGGNAPFIVDNSTGDAAPQTEGAAKAEITLVLPLSILPLQAIAAFVGKVADRPAGSGENAADAILAQAMLVQAASKLPVDGCIVASDTFAKLVTMKAVGGGGYLVGSPLGAPTSTLWGQLRLAISVNQPTGTAIVGAFGRAAAIYRKAALRIDLSDSHSDFFVKNLTAIRAEQRELLAVFKPLGFGTATGLLTIPA